MPTKIYLVRHAQALHNAPPAGYSGNAETDEIFKDALLTDVGHWQTTKLKEKLIDMKFDAIYCSPLRRCYQTLKGAYPRSVYLNVKIDDRLIEQPHGTHTSNHRLDKKELGQNSPVNWDLTNVSDINPHSIKEKRSEYEIIINFMDEVINYHQEQSVLVVSHGKWISRLLKIYYGKGEHINNCDCIEITFETPNNA